jgi:hypothetical protein
MTFTYDPSGLPEGMTAENIRLAFYDETTGTWTDYECTVDMANHTVTAVITHFSTYAVIAWPPPPEPVPTTTAAKPPATEPVIQPQETVAAVPSSAATAPRTKDPIMVKLPPAPSSQVTPAASETALAPPAPLPPENGISGGQIAWSIAGGLAGIIVVFFIIRRVYRVKTGM